MELEVYSPISAEAEVKSYTLVGDDIYVKRYTNENVPDWYRQLISDIIATDNTITDLDAAVDYLSTLPAGYNQKITELQAADTTINTSLTSLVATTGSHTAAIANLGITKVDATSAAAIARDTVGAYFTDGTAGAWFNNQISTYASDITANAMDISTLSATVNGQTVMIEDISSVSIDPVTGYMLGASKLGTAPDGSITGWQFADGTNVQSSFKIMATNFSVSDGTTGYTPFSISGSDILFNGKVQFTNVTGTPVINQTFVQTTAPTSGMVTGDTWLDSDGGYAVYTYTGSSWVPGGSKTYSQTSAPTSGMVAGDLWVDTDDNNKLYRYNGTSWVNQTLTSGGIISAINGTTNTTTIDGGKITTGSVTTNQLNVTDVKAGSIFVDNTLTSSDFTVLGGAGFRLKSNAAGTYADPTMYGAYIRGGTIDSSTMNVRLLNLVNDFDYSVYPLFASYAPCTYVPIGGTNQFYLSIPFNFYTANSTFVTRNKLASLDDNVLLLTAAASSYGIHGGTITDSASMTSKVGTIALINCEVSETVRVSIYINGAEYSYIDVGGGAGDVNLNGFRFYRGGTGEGYGLFMYADHTSVSLNSTDEFPIELRITRLSNQPEDWVTYRTNTISLLVANIS